MYILACFAILIVLVMYVKMLRRRKKAGIKGWVQSQDLDGRGRKVYRDSKTGISAKPDVVENKRVIEVKSASVKDKARRSDILQLAAEMIASGRQVGELRYGNNKKFEFRLDSPKMRALRGELSRISGLMDRHLRMRIPPKGTPTRNKCAKCDYRRECSDAIAA